MFFYIWILKKFFPNNFLLILTRQTHQLKYITIVQKNKEIKITQMMSHLSNLKINQFLRYYVIEFIISMKNSKNVFIFDSEEDEVDITSTNNQNIRQQKVLTNKNAKAYFFDEEQSDADDGNKKQQTKHQESSSDIEDDHQNQINQKNMSKKNGILQEKVQQNRLSRKNQSQKKQNMFAGLQVKEKTEKKFQYVSEKKALKVSDIRNFLAAPLGDYKIKAIIKRINSGFLNTSTKFQVIIEQNNRFLFSVLRNGLSEYIFSLSKQIISSKNKNYLGFMDCNVFGTEFKLYDCGFSPSQTRSLEHCRRQLASIVYESNKGPRKFQTIVSTNSQGFYALESDNNTLLQMWNKKKRDSLSKLYSQSPEYDAEDGNYKLDFKGIVKKASIKNFILGGKEWKDTLIFGKIDDDTFIMEIKEPLSLLQAAAICISSIHYKLK